MALEHQAAAQRNMAALESRAEDIKCAGAFPSAPAASAGQPASSFDQCFPRCKQYTDRTNEQTLSTLVHEMTHLQQQHFGKPSRSGYHNKEWGLLMRAVGLIPSSTGEPGGKETGQRGCCRPGPLARPAPGPVPGRTAGCREPARAAPGRDRRRWRGPS